MLGYTMTDFTAEYKKIILSLILACLALFIFLIEKDIMLSLLSVGALILTIRKIRSEVKLNRQQRLKQDGIALFPNRA